ncbi:putative O-methyltransferase [Venturia nashicola]|uniref:Putative O-methyltransferase n=1 Tax=Venturia nashicola TaxID=86259 RepID=A0A4Z1NZ19_9PEZI|nr:putative O-methyltransferase [Venturia nashicola]TLD34630.1 putative O-methyltransferase [Venturia nashicola]
MDTTTVTSIVAQIAAAGKAYGSHEVGSRESLIDLSRSLISALEIPSEFLQRSFWAEPALAAHCKLAGDVKLFNHLKDAGEKGLAPADLAEKTDVDIFLLQRIVRHLVAMNLVSFRDGRIYRTDLSDGLAAENYKQSIDFCFDVARPSFNSFPDFFKKNGYKVPGDANKGPFQAAHKTDLPFFDWLVATPPHLDEFSAFMSAYRAGKANWFDKGFYPVAERLIEGFDSSISETLLVDVGGGRGHDVAMFAAEHASHPGKLVLQDREPVIASVADKASLPFESQAHDFYTPQPIKGARAYSLHSILHDWDDEHGVKILENLRPALIPGYSRVLLNEIVLSEEHPTIAATSMDMMMIAHLGVRERTEADWKAIIEKAGLKFLKVYTYPGVAESVIEAELAGNTQQ